MDIKNFFKYMTSLMKTIIRKLITMENLHHLEKTPPLGKRFHSHTLEHFVNI